MPTQLPGTAYQQHMLVKVEEGEIDKNKAKRRFLEQWAKAVNMHRDFGHCEWALSQHPADVYGILREKSKTPKALV